MELLVNPIILVLVTLTILIYSAILHEIAHGFVADKLGDPTARLLGRLTLDPRPHIDPFMSLLLPLILFFTSPIIFGGAKPVPVDPFNLRDGRKDLALVSLAGPATNFLIALVATIIVKLFFIDYSLQELLGGINSFPSLQSFTAYILGTTVYLNVLLGIFNLLPIPPLDGSKIFSLLLPPRAAHTYLSLGSGPFGMMLLFGLLLFSGIQSVIRTIMEYAISLLRL